MVLVCSEGNSDDDDDDDTVSVSSLLSTAVAGKPGQNR